MATASVTNTFVSATTISSSAANTNFQDLVDFLNDSVVHRDGSKSMSGNLNLGGNALTNGYVFGYGGNSLSDVTLSAGAGSYQALHTISSVPAGTYLAIASCFIESTTLTADVAFTAHIRRDSDSTVYQQSRVRQFGAVTGSATHLSPLTIVAIVTLTATDTVRFRMVRDVASGTQTARNISLHLIPFEV